MTGSVAAMTERKSAHKWACYNENRDCRAALAMTGKSGSHDKDEIASLRSQ